MLRQARRRAGLSQRSLAATTGVAQPTIARIESGHADPRVATLARLLQACGQALQAAPAPAATPATAPLPGAGIDRTAIGELLALTPAQRLEALMDESPVLERLDRARRVE